MRSNRHSWLHTAGQVVRRDRTSTVQRSGALPVVAGPGPADQRARGLGGELRTAEVCERRGQRVVGGGGVSVLSEMVSKSP